MGQTILAAMSAFLNELMRRNVVRAGVAYLALSWVIGVLTVTIGQRYDAPPAVASAVIALLALGFLAVLALSWRYELTPEGLKRTKDVSEEQTITHTTGRRLDYVILAALVLMAVVALIDRFVISKLVTREPVVATPVEAPQPPPAAAVPSLAVVPFSASVPDADNEMLAQGFTRALRERLAGLSGLRVAGAESSFHFAGKAEAPGAIAQGLKVDHLLKGALTFQEAGLALTAELIDARSATPLWSQDFAFASADLAATEEAIARAVVGALKVALSATDEARLAKQSTADAEAYRLGLLASAHLSHRDRDSLRRAKAQFEAALARDPSDGAAYAGLAQAYVLLMVNYGEELKLGETRALEAAEKAIALDADMARAYLARASLARLRVLRDDDMQAHVQALADFGRAAALDPANADAVHALGAEMAYDNPAEALKLFEKALAIDPLRRQAEIDAAMALASLGDATAALNAFERLVAAHPDFPAGYSAYGLLQARLGRLDEAAVLFGRAFEISADPFTAAYLWAVNMELGELETARAMRERIRGADLFDTLRRALGFAAGSRYADERALLERKVRAGADDGRFVHAAAVLALAAQEPARALELLKGRYPSLFAGEAINVLNFASALDLAAAFQATGQQAEADALLARVAAYLDGPNAPKLPLFMVARAQAHALKGALDEAMRALDEAYDAGFRTTWGLLAATRPGQLNPYPIEIDPRFGALRDDTRFAAWLSRIKDDNAAQAAALKERLAAPAPATPAN